MLKFLEKISWITLVAFFIIIPLAFITNHGLFYPYVHNISLFSPFKEVIARQITLFLLILLLIQFAFFKKPILRTPFYFPLLLIVIYQVCSLLWAHNKFQGFEFWIHWSCLFVFFFVCLNLLKDRDSIRTIMKIALIPAFMICCISIICYAFHVDLPFFKNRVFGWSATFGNYKFAGEYVTPLIFWALGLCLSEKRKWEKWFYFFITLFFIVSLLFVYKSRASLAALMVLSPPTFIFFYLRFKSVFHSNFYSKAAKMITCFCVLMLPLLFTQKVSRGESIFNTFKSIFSIKHVSNDQRIVIWKNTLKMSKDYFWFGAGIGNFNLLYPFYTSAEDLNEISVASYNDHFIRQAHHEYLQLLSELGIIGLSLYMILFFLMCKKTFDFVRKKPEEEFLTLCLFLSFLCSSIIAFFVFNFQNAASSFFFIATIAFLVKMISDPNKTLVIRALPLKICTLALILLLSCFTPKALMNHFMATYYQYQGRSFMSTFDLRALTIFQKSLKWSPYDWETHFLIGKTYGDHFLFPQAIAHLKKSLELNPSYESTLFNLGLYLEKDKKLDEATHMYERFLKISPDFQSATLRLGYIALSKNKIEKAKTHFKKVLNPAYHPDKGSQAKAYQGLAICHFREGKHKKVTHELLESFLLDPELDKTDPLFKYYLENN